MQRDTLALLASATVPFLFNTGLQLSGFNSTTLTTICWIVAAAILLLAGASYLRKWNDAQRSEGKKGVQANHFLLAGLAGTWVFLSLALGAAAWLIWRGNNLVNSPSKTDQVALQDEGPVQWVHNLWMTGGSPKVFAISFRGANISKDQAILLKEANIISLIDGTLMPLEIVAVDANGENKTVALDQVHLIPPGAPIELVVKFGGLDAQGHINGIEAKAFLEKWRQFAFSAKDGTRSYRMEFNENIMAVFFQGKVGPRVAVKAG
jgi:hypothetical protein